MLRINLHPAHCARTTRPRPVGAGLDTLHLWVSAPVNAATVAQLLPLQAAAVSDGKPRRVTVGPVELEIDPRWRRTILATSDLYAVKVEQHSVKNVEATVTVEVRALALWSLGWRRAGDVAVEILRACTQADAVAEVSRADVALDFQGWAPTMDERHRFVSRARHRGLYWSGETDPRWEDGAWLDSEAERVRKLALRLDAASRAERAEVLRTILRPPAPATEAAYQQARDFTGFAFGRGAVAARLYDKTREIAVSRKGWFRTVWRKAGLREREAVWRLEFQVRRSALRQFEVSDEGGTVDLSTWPVLSMQLDQLWRNLCVRWLRHGKRTATCRHALSRQWSALAAAAPLTQDCAPRPELHRVALKGALESVVPALAGYLATAAAQHTELDESSAPPDVGNAMVAVVLAAERYALTHGEPLDAKCASARARIAARRRHVAGRHQPQERREQLAAAKTLAAAGRARASGYVRPDYAVAMPSHLGPVHVANAIPGYYWRRQDAEPGSDG